MMTKAFLIRSAFGVNILAADSQIITPFPMQLLKPEN